ncbi:helix-turn-helix domain-containing protein [Rathayibacter sp. KR2-224]|uniref:AraC family transcriptional regulator n=1 Tax=Rathayibacter sp. KR2-224 TaxID=3400913 RepID=UPI003BFD04B3
MTGTSPKSRGHLNPGDPRVAFDRFALPREFDALVRHVWVVRWHVPIGEEAAQRVLAYPAFNAVLETSSHQERPDQIRGLALYPPTGRVAVRRLYGEGAAVGVLLRPCAGRVLLEGSGVLPSAVPVQGLPLTDAHGIETALTSASRDRVRDALVDWLRPHAGLVGERDRLVNEACRLAEEDASLERAADLAAAIGVTPRTLERTVREYLGLSPKWLIECRRLQAAATTLYTEPHTDLSELAAQLGFADYAHFSRRYRSVLGETPAQTRNAGRSRATA